MTELIDQRIKDWIESDMRLVSAHHPSSIHVDDLLGRDIDKSEIIGVSIHVFTGLVDQMQYLHMPAQPMLVIPLQAISERIEMAAPHSLKEIERQLDIAPPSLYLMSWDTCNHFETYEEYRLSLQADILGNLINRISLSYREFRDVMGINNNWEFSRGIYAEFCPHLRESR